MILGKYAPAPTLSMQVYGLVTNSICLNQPIVVGKGSLPSLATRSPFAPDLLKEDETPIRASQTALMAAIQVWYSNLSVEKHDLVREDHTSLSSPGFPQNVMLILGSYRQMFPEMRTPLMPIAMVGRSLTAILRGHTEYTHGPYGKFTASQKGDMVIADLQLFLTKAIYGVPSAQYTFVYRNLMRGRLCKETVSREKFAFFRKLAD
ncbi:hypothetical protein V8C44DRAFT_106485 [Trichoderma aethiopicum]